MLREKVVYILLAANKMVTILLAAKMVNILLAAKQ
jgi:hypothetical protein